MPEGFRRHGGEQGFGGGRRAGRPPRNDSGPKTQTVHLPEPGAEGEETTLRLKAAQVRTGISDGANTVMLSGLAESDEVVTAILSIEGNRYSSASANPFGLSFGRGGGAAGASLAIQPGEFAAIMDASGSGKSTLINITSWTAWMYCACHPKNERKFGTRKLGLSFKDSICWRALPLETTSICPCFMRNRRSAEKSSGNAQTKLWRSSV